MAPQPLSQTLYCFPIPRGTLICYQLLNRMLQTFQEREGGGERPRHHFITLYVQRRGERVPA